MADDIPLPPPFGQTSTRAGWSGHSTNPVCADILAGGQVDIPGAAVEWQVSVRAKRINRQRPEIAPEWR